MIRRGSCPGRLQTRLLQLLVERRRLAPLDERVTPLVQYFYSGIVRHNDKLMHPSGHPIESRRYGDRRALRDAVRFRRGRQERSDPELKGVWVSQKTALNHPGVTGQDGSGISPSCCSTRAIGVVGMTRRTSTDVHERIQHLVDRIEIVSGDLLDQSSMSTIIADVRPHEIYNLAAQSFVPTSWQQPVLTGEFTALGVTRVLEAIRAVDRDIKFYQASSSEMFGKVQTVPQKRADAVLIRVRRTGVAKLYGHWITVNYRESYDIFACSGNPV